jgi:CRISPR-associated endonuclease/helicase Cas3
MSDYYATLDFMQNMAYFDKILVITPEIADKCEKNFYKVNFNKKLNDKTYCKKLLNSNISDINDLNELRTRMLLESDNKLEESLIKQPEQRVFYLNIPTGGGKTNVSLKLALTLLKSKKNIKRIFYVFPFINLIEQNHSVIKETLGLTEELSSVYSTSGWDIGVENKEEQLKYTLDNEFLNHPFVVISNVNFFNTFVKSGKISNYRLINLANSIVIIDEIQSLNDKDWTLFNDLIEFGSTYINIHFIIMSATLPKLDALSDVNGSSVALNLIDNPDGYFNHPLFKNRVLIEYRDNVNDLEQLLHVLKDELHDDMNKILLVVNTIKNSLELYKKIRNNKEIQNLERFQIYLLNSTILPHRRREIIQKMKDDKSKVLLISTQSVEAGMDIDCDFGIRDFSIFDSIEQIAGRINRNFKNQKNTSKLIITNLKEDNKKIADFIYSDSYRWQTLQMNFASRESIEDFLTERNFDDYYTKVLENIKSRDRSWIHQSSYDTVKKGIRSLDFEELNKSDVIKQDSISIIVNSEVPKEEFSCAELDFIKNEGITYEGEISGKSIWVKYNEFIKNFQRGYIDRKIKTKIWSSILSKFTINVRNYHIRGYQKLSDIIDLDKGIPLLKKENYSNEEGIDPKLLDRYSFEIPI